MSARPSWLCSSPRGWQAMVDPELPRQRWRETGRGRPHQLAARIYVRNRSTDGFAENCILLCHIAQVHSSPAFATLGPALNAGDEFSHANRLAQKGVALNHTMRIGPGSLGDDFELVYNADAFGHSFERLPFLALTDLGAVPNAPPLCQPRCAASLKDLLSSPDRKIIERKLRNLNLLSDFPITGVKLPTPAEYLVRVIRGLTKE